MDKKFLLILFFGIILIICSYNVLGAASFTVINQYYNYTTNLNLSLTTVVTVATNLTCHYNASGGNAFPGGTELVSMNGTSGFNITIDITGLDSSLLYNYNISCNASNVLGTQSNQTSLNNITFDSTAPNMTFYNVVSGGYYKDSVNFNVSILDAMMGVQTVYFNVTNSTGTNISAETGLVTEQGGDFYSNNSFDTSAHADGVYNLTVYANDSLNNLNTTTISFTIDNTNPSPSALTLSSATIGSLTITFSGADGTCTVDRSGAEISGSTLTEDGLSCGTSYSYTITCTDTAGNTGSSSATSFSTSSCGGDPVGGGGGVSSSKIHSWVKITPGSATVMKNFNVDTGVEEITIEVKNEAHNVKITVKRYDGKPIEVSVAKAGKVYKYLEIKTENLADKLKKAMIRIRVEKSWATQNGLTQDSIALFKFVGEKWQELTTTYTEADDGYYYYDVELDSFSYFTIAETERVEEEPVEESVIEQITGENLTWLWVSIGVLLVVGLVVLLILRGKSKAKK